MARIIFIQRRNFVPGKPLEIIGQSYTLRIILLKRMRKYPREVKVNMIIECIDKKKRNAYAEVEFSCATELIKPGTSIWRECVLNMAEQYETTMYLFTGTK